MTTTTKERPIIFSGPMVRALLAGTKTQTRRVMKHQPTHFNPAGVPRVANPYFGPSAVLRCPYGQPGDLLWVRETFAKIDGQTRPWIETDYRATYAHGDRLGDHLGIKKRWTPPIHMPRAASRITLEITEVRVERLQEISEADAVAEGCARLPLQDGHGAWWSADVDAGPALHGRTARDAYRLLWESINGPGSWGENPWVWVIAFKVCS